MLFLAQANSSVLLLLGVGLVWYVAARAGTDALAGQSASPGFRALAQAMPAIVGCLYAAWRGEAALALGMLFAASVAALTLVFGVITLTTPPSLLAVEARRKWAFVLPTALLALLAGFKGQLTLTHALALAVEGLALLLLWHDSPRSALAAPLPAPEVALESGEAGEAFRPGWLPPLEICLAIALCALGAVGAIIGARDLAGKWNVPSPGIVATLLLGPAIVLPMVGSGTLLAHRGQYSAAVSTLVGFALINLCGVLPAVIVVWHVSHATTAVAGAANALAYVHGMFAHDPPLVYSMSVWRVDTVILVVIGVFLLPVSIGRWLPGKLEAAALILVYAIYLTMASFAAGGRI